MMALIPRLNEKLYKSIFPKAKEVLNTLKREVRE